MTPLKQRNLHDPENGVYGDCHRAAIASILDLALDDVPHFMEDDPPPDEFKRREREFLLARGLVSIDVPFKAELAEVLAWAKGVNPGVYYLLGGRSRIGADHTVIGLDDAIVHDPSLLDSGIVGPCADGHFWLTFFGSTLAVATTINRGIVTSGETPESGGQIQ